MADEQVRSAVQETIFQAAHGYLDVLLGQHLYQISVDAVRSAGEHLRSVNQKRKVGTASDFDVLRSEVELANFNAELIRNRNAIRTARAGLVRLMGVSQDSSFELSDRLVYKPETVDEESAVEAAMKNRPDLFQRQLNIEMQNKLLDISNSSYWPRISGVYDFIWSNPDPHNAMKIDWGRKWMPGLWHKCLSLMVLSERVILSGKRHGSNRRGLI